MHVTSTSMPLSWRACRLSTQLNIAIELFLIHLLFGQQITMCATIGKSYSINTIAAGLWYSISLLASMTSKPKSISSHFMLIIWLVAPFRSNDACNIAKHRLIPHPQTCLGVATWGTCPLNILHD